MQDKRRILVLFVEPMHYGLDLVREVYEKTDLIYQYVYCHSSVTGKDSLTLPDGAIVCEGDNKARKVQIQEIFERFQPHFAVINGYVGVEQTFAIRYCQKHRIGYAIESDTPLHIPSSKIKAFLKKQYLKTLLRGDLTFGFAGGSLQRDNFLYYGMAENRALVMPMCISEDRLLKEKASLPSKQALKEKYGLQDKKVFLFVGRLTEVKNVSLLIKSFAALKKQREDIALALVGDGDLREELTALVKVLDCPDIHFFGYVGFPQNVEFYKLADVFVLPSLHEPWGLVVNEAMIMGLPVIVSSKVGCRKDLVAQGENGLIFEDGDESGLTKAMEWMLGADLAAFSQRSLEKIKDWNFERYLLEFMQVIDYATD